MAIPQAFLQELLQRVDIVEVVGRHVALKKGGINLMGLCPFHGEKSPSFTVSPQKQFFHCFGCGKHGNAIGFLMEHTGVGFVDAVKDLAQNVGLVVPQEDASPELQARVAEQRDQAQRLHQLLEKVHWAYRQQLKGSERAIDYLKRRGLSGQMAKRFGLGYAPAGWRFLSTVLPDYQDPALVDAGLVIVPATGHATAGGQPEGRRYDRFRDRVMFPIRNLKGECVGFGGRVLDQGEPKYLNSPETPVFSKGHELYGLYEARNAIRNAGYALVTEGYMDVVALAQSGFEHAVATLGTACTADHLRLLFRCTDNVVFAFDGDAAGRRAARKALEVALPWATDTRSLRFLFLPTEHDPDSYIRSHGSAAFATAVAGALPLSEFLLEVASHACDLASAEGRARTVAQAKPLWQALPEGVLKRQLLHALAQQAQLGHAELEQLWEAHGSVHGAAVPAKALPLAAPAPRPRPTARPDRANARAPALPGGGRSGHHPRIVQLLLQEPQAWERLSENDRQCLANAPAPYGACFAWLETEWQEHGAQEPQRLQERARAQGFAALLPRNDALPTPEWPQELAEWMRRLHIEALKQAETACIAQAEQNHPEALARYRELQQARRALETESRDPHSH